jgi:hypothetical protein
MRLTEFASRRLFAAAIIFAATSIDSSRTALADEPRLAFDFGRTLECRDVTPPDFAETYPDERIVECTLRLSVQLAGGSASDIQSLRVEIADRDRRLRVFDFSPSTKMESTLAKDIKWSKTTESSNDFGVSLGGELPAVIGDVVAHMTPTINASKGGKESVTETQVRYAPQQVVVASGTIDQEHGVFFTLRPSPLTSLEGVHELTVAFIVPSHWRSDAVQVTCSATGTQKMLWMKQQKVWAEQAGGVALYLAGDGEARRAAERRMR